MQRGRYDEGGAAGGGCGMTGKGSVGVQRVGDGT